MTEKYSVDMQKLQSEMGREPEAGLPKLPDDYAPRKARELAVIKSIGATPMPGDHPGGAVGQLQENTAGLYEHLAVLDETLNFLRGIDKGNLTPMPQEKVPAALPDIAKTEARLIAMLQGIGLDIRKIVKGV